MSRRWLFGVWRWLPERLKWAILWRTNRRFVAGAMGLVVEEGRVLLLRHDYRASGQWGLPGGWIGGHEGPAEALARELREETGLIVQVGEPAAVYRAPDVPRLDIVFHCRVVGGVLALSDEIAEARYFGADELPADMYPEQRALVCRVLPGESEDVSTTKDRKGQ